MESWLLKNLIIIILLEIIRGSYNRHLPSILFIWAITILEPAEFSSFRFLPWIWILKQRQYLNFTRVLDFQFVSLTSNNDNFFQDFFWKILSFFIFYYISMIFWHLVALVTCEVNKIHLFQAKIIKLPEVIINNWYNLQAFM